VTVERVIFVYFGSEVGPDYIGCLNSMKPQTLHDSRDRLCKLN